MYLSFLTLMMISSLRWVKRAAYALYVAAWHAFTVGDIRRPELLLAVSRETSVYADDFSTAMAGDQA